jgi:methionyl-tRNA synthetase
MPETPKFYVTTPIYYVNARPHIGHAYTTIVADVVARRRRLLGDDTFFLTGTDEHGQKIERAAAAAGVAPQAFADEVSAAFEGLWRRMGITNSGFIRTTDPRHKRGVQKLFGILKERGFIELRTYAGQYCVSEEMFVEGPPGTIGPDGRPTETVSEENFFFKLSEFQERLIGLIESNELEIQPESRRNEVLSFLRGNIAPALNTLINPRSTPAEIEAADRQMSGATSTLGNPYVPGALKDLSISRSSFTWGIPVPEPAASEAKEKHVVYVWLDALANYLTAIGFGSDEPEDVARFERYWPADLHLVGKEIIRFHCVYWPAFLMAAGLPLPKKIVAHGWLLFEESKMSKSRGNIVRTETILDAFGNLVYASLFPKISHAEQDLFAADVLRYYLLREIPFGQDGSFSFDALITRYNADLANGYGNLVSRLLAMIWKFSDGEVSPRTSLEGLQTYSIQDDDGLAAGHGAIAGLAVGALAQFGEGFDRYDFAATLGYLWGIIARCDKYISDNAPWKLAKSEEAKAKARLSDVLYTSAEFIRIITALLYPILPYATASVWRQLGLGEIEEAAKRGELKDLEWGGLKPGTKLGALAPIFPRADKGLTQIMADMEAATSMTDDSAAKAPAQGAEGSLHPAAGPRTSSFSEPNPGAHVGASSAEGPELFKTPPHGEAQASGPFATAAAASSAPDTPQISIDDFVKVDLRVARILVAERIPKADKLLRLEVDLGYEKRQILAGIAEHYAPETLIGRKVVIVANLAPRKMRGLESQGMLVAASLGEQGRPVLAGFLEDVEVGGEVEVGSVERLNRGLERMNAD